ncbi:IS1595 family transposase [Allosphingosinicella sp.]|uniref:IS1595 family transposase n=1 Tax=Allosphingosinicella sp. TaxID=2823234 RepID=UPI002FC12EAB
MFDLTNPIFTDADKAREHLESINWPEGPFCPHCGECENVHRLQGKSHRPGLIQCNSCLKNFTVTVGTVFERSKVPLNKWMLATYLLASSKKGMSAHQLHRMLGVTYKTAWFMMHRVREAMKDDSGPLGGPGKVVESDEAFVGGKKKNRLSGKTAPKKKVVALVERNGRARSFHIANIHANNVRSVLVSNVDRASTLMTDEARHYWAVGREFASHGHTLHASRKFGKGETHSNTAENFFSILKRGVIGTYHHMSEAHMHRYLAEFDFRYSTKADTDKERSDAILRGIVGKRLTYRRSNLLAA